MGKWYVYTDKHSVVSYLSGIAPVGIGTEMGINWLPRFHRACPSTSLDKNTAYLIRSKNFTYHRIKIRVCQSVFINISYLPQVPVHICERLDKVHKKQPYFR